MHPAEFGIYGAAATAIITTIGNILAHRRRQAKAIRDADIALKRAEAPVQIAAIDAQMTSEQRLWSRLETLESRVDGLHRELADERRLSASLAAENSMLRQRVSWLESQYDASRDHILREYIAAVPSEPPPPASVPPGSLPPKRVSWP
jgi:hypothetical protein